MFKMAHVGLRVRDLEHSKNFYETVMGFHLEKSLDLGETRLAFMELGDMALELVEKKHMPYPGEGPAPMHLAFHVDNVRTEIERLKELQVPLNSDEPIPFQGGYIFFFKGPDGESLELCQA
jgi:lactoylglutathione lyase